MPATVQISAEFTGLQSSLEKQISAATRGGGIKIPVNDRVFNESFKGMTGNVRAFEQSLDFANRRVITFGTSASLIYGTVRAFKELVSATIDVERTMTSINSIFNLSNRSLDTLSKSLFDVARQTGQAFDEVSAAAEEFSRQGLGVEETLKRTRDTMVLVRLTGIDTAKAVSTLTAAVTAFGKSGEDSTSILNKLVAADQRFAVSAKDIAEAFTKVGSVVNDAGVSIDQFVGLVTAARQITAQSGNTIGNSLKTILTRLERSTTVDQLEAMGIAVRDVTDNVKPALQVFDQLAQSYKNLSREQRQQIAQLGGGVFQINQFKALLLDLGKANGIAAQATNTATNATNEALIRNAALNDTLAYSLQNLKTSATQAGAVVGALSIKPALNTLLGTGNIFASLFQNIKSTGDTKPGEDIGAYIGESILKGIGNVLSGPGLVFLGKIVAGLAKRLAPEILTDANRASTFFTQGTRNFNTALNPPDETAAIRRTNDLLAQGTKEEQARYFAAKSVADQEAAILAILERQALVAAELAGLTRAQNAKILSQEAALSGANSTHVAYRPRAAGGFLPIGAESAAIAGGVGGAPSSASPVYLPGFNRGGGNFGIVANTSEFVVPHMAGGSAIFNRDMIQRYGLPPGSTPVAASGFIPNAAGGDLRSAAEIALGTGLPRSGAPITTIDAALSRAAPGLAALDAQEKAWEAALSQFQQQTQARLAQRATEMKTRVRDFGRAEAEITSQIPSSTKGLNKTTADLEDKKEREMAEGFRLMEKENEQTRIKTSLTQADIKLAEEGLDERRANINAARTSRAISQMPINRYGGTSGTSELESTEAYHARVGSPSTGGSGNLPPILNQAAIERRRREIYEDNAKMAESATFDNVLAKRRSANAQRQADARLVDQSRQRSNRASNLQTSLLVGSLAAGFIQDRGTTGQTSGELSGAAGGALTGGAFGASIGSIFGPIGTFVGAGVGGAAGAIKGFVDRMDKSFSELADDINKETEKIKSQIDATSQAFSSQDDLLEAQSKGASPRELAKLGSRYRTNLSSITDPEIQALVIKGQFDPEARAEASRRQSESASRQSQQRGYELIQKKAEDESGFFPFLGRLYNPFGDNNLAYSNPETVRQGGGSIQSVLAKYGDKELAQVAKQIRGPQYEGTFTQDATISALNRETELRGLEREIQAQQLASAGPRPILRPEALALGSRIKQEGQLGQVRSSAEGQILAALNQSTLSRGGLGSDVSRLALVGQLGRESIGQSFAGQRSATLSEGVGSIITSLGGEGVRGRPIYDRLQEALSSKNPTGSLESIISELPQGKLISGAENASQTAKATQTALEELVSRLKVLTETEKQAIKVNDTSNDLQQQLLVFQRSLVGAQSEDIDNLANAQKALEGAVARRESPETILAAQDAAASAQGRQDVRNIDDPAARARARSQLNVEDLQRTLGRSSLSQQTSDNAVIGLAKQGSSFLDGTTVENALLGDANRTGRLDGSSKGSFQEGFKSLFAGAKQELTNLADVGSQVGHSLQANLGNAFGDFVTGAKSAKDAFRSFVTSVLSDAARAFASKAVVNLLAMIFGNLGGTNTSGAKGGTPVITNVGSGGGFISRASGGSIPTVLTGGEYVYPPSAASRIGDRNLRSINTGTMRGFAPGGLVRGGSGVKDDVFQPLAAGSFVVRKAMVERYGANNLASLAIGGYPDAMDSMTPTALRMEMGGGPTSSAMSTPSPMASGGGGGTFNIGVTIHNNSTSSSTTSTQGSQSPYDRQFGADLARKVQQLTLQTIQEQKRIGGTLRPQSNLFPS